MLVPPGSKTFEDESWRRLRLPMAVAVVPELAPCLNAEQAVPDGPEAFANEGSEGGGPDPQYA